MGTQPDQPLTLVCDFPKSKFYLVSVRLDEIKSVEVPANIEWAMLVAYHRGRMENIKGTAFYNKYQKLTREYDIVIGSIADDKMFQVLDDFFIGNITDVALTKSLAALELGKQYVAVTKKGVKRSKWNGKSPFLILKNDVFKLWPRKTAQEALRWQMISVGRIEEKEDILTRFWMRFRRDSV